MLWVELIAIPATGFVKDHQCFHGPQQTPNALWFIIEKECLMQQQTLKFYEEEEEKVEKKEQKSNKHFTKNKTVFFNS